MKKILVALTAFVLVACAGNPSLTTRQIDQPYTLPEDTKEFYFGAGVSRVKEDFFGDTTRLSIPLGWNVPINKDWTWEILTLVRHQFHHDEVNTYGTRFGSSNLGYSSLSGVIAEPEVSFFWRHKFAENFALENTLGGSYIYRSKRNDLEGWTSYLKLSPRFQLDDTKALSPFVIASYERRYSWASRLANIFPENRPLLTAPLGLDFAWRLSQQWETNLSYSYNSIGYTRGFSSHTIGLVAHLYW